MKTEEVTTAKQDGVHKTRIGRDRITDWITDRITDWIADQITDQIMDRITDKKTKF